MARVKCARSNQCNCGVASDQVSRIGNHCCPNVGDEHSGTDRPSEDQNDAGLCGGRGTDEKLPLPNGTDGANHGDWREDLKLDEHYDRGRNCNWRGGVQHDAKGAVVGVSIHRVDVGHLDEGEHRKQRQAHEDHYAGLRPAAAIATRPCLKSGQTQASCEGDLLKNTCTWMHRVPRCHMRKTLVVMQPQTRQDEKRLNCWTMRHFSAIGLALSLVLATGLAVIVPSAAQDNEEKHGKAITPDAPGLTHNHKLILKDGSYQMVRKYEVVGDRVRYLSLERGEWEELPNDLVDWDATRRWEQNHVGPYQSPNEASDAMKEAAAIDKEEAAERDEMKARMPEVAKGLELPDQDGVFVLDTYQGTPELVELVPSDLNLHQKDRKGLATLNPLAGSRATIELNGANAKVHLHVNDPEIYVALESQDEVEHVLSHAMTVQTHGGQVVAGDRKHGAHSPQSGFAIVKVDERREVRIIGGINVSPTGKVTQSENVIPAKADVLPGKHWLKLTPEATLSIGEYALVEILSPSDISQSVWDFRVDPRMGDNPGSLGPILK